MLSKTQNIKVVNDLSKVDPEIMGPGAALYVRVTREESVKQGLSIPNQCNRGLEVASARGWSWVKLYVESRHVGGDLWIDKRKALAELIEDLKSGKIKRVFARHHDRLWRSSEIRDQLLHIFKEHDVEFWDFDGPKDYRTASGKFALKVQGDASEYEKDITGERIREMKRGKARAGRPAGGPPTFGYTTQARLKRDIMAKNGLSEEEAYKQACEKIPNAHEWYIDWSEAEAVVLVISAYSFREPEAITDRTFDEWPLSSRERILSVFKKLKGPVGVRSIANLLNAQGYTRRSGEAWVGSKVLRIINDPVIFGYVTYDERSYERKRPSSLPKHRQTLYKGVHEPVIKPRLWNEVQLIKQQKTVNLRTKQKNGRVFPLSKIIFCGRCGAPMRTRSLGRARPFAYYVCRNRSYYGADKTHNPKACDFPGVNVAQVEAAVWPWVLEVLESGDCIAEYLKGANQKLSESIPKARVLALQKKKEASQVEQNIQKYYKRYESAKDSGEEELAWQRLVELKNQKNELAQEINCLERELSKTPRQEFSEDQVKKYLQELRSFLLKNKDKRRFLYQLLHMKHNFRIVARSKYCIEPKIDLTDKASMIEIDPSRYPASDDSGSEKEDSFLDSQLVYEPKLSFDEIHGKNGGSEKLPNGLLAYCYPLT